MTDNNRKNLYITLLRGLADEAQERMCREDRNHAWGPWVRYQVLKDEPLGPLSLEPMAMNETYRLAARRMCECCGKEDFTDNA